jgi:CBS domain-containing protein
MEVYTTMIISKLMTKPVVRIDENSTVQEAIVIMSAESFGTLLVTRHGQDIGVLTAGDIITKVLAQKHALDMVLVKEIMSTPLITADKQITGEDALRMMVNNNVGRLLITDNEEIVGIFSTSDVTKLVP